MQQYRRQLLLQALELFDVSAIAGSIALGALAYSERTNPHFGDLLSLRLKVLNIVVIVTLLSLCHLILRTMGLYKSRRLSSRRAETADVVKAITVCALVLAFAAVVLKIEIINSRSFLVVFWTASAGTLVGSRIILRRVLAQLRRKGRNLRQVLIVGTNKRATALARTIENKRELGYILLGFADDPWPGSETLGRRDYPVVTDLLHLREFLREVIVDEVFVCLPVKSRYENIREIIEHCENEGVVVRLLGQFFDLRIARAKVEMLEDDTVVSVYTGQMEGWAVVAKRTFDTAASLLLLIVLAPVFLVTAIAIALTSGGPVFFVQQRVGISKRRFRLFKFRTMVADAEQRQHALEALNEVSGPVFKIQNDPRITPLGRLLRKTSIDELPQLLNVLRGDMSLVGPRPLPLRDYYGFNHDTHRRRFSVRPGITCLWQANGRGTICFDDWMELDMQYIDHWSLWLDLKILMKTVPAVFKGSGAA